MPRTGTTVAPQDEQMPGVPAMSCRISWLDIDSRDVLF